MKLLSSDVEYYVAAIINNANLLWFNTPIYSAGRLGDNFSSSFNSDCLGHLLSSPQNSQAKIYQKIWRCGINFTKPQ